ncbi:hypothetical protein, partial [uncultured Flavobacterium sp.]|uniref:hypothetical protein n=1 Tax=uncultured Flavobacterium sp. TaxID=165435 RepID=UPI0025D20817
EEANPNSNTKSIRAFFDGYTDENITSCIQKDSVRLATFYSGNNYKHEEKYFKQYSELLEKYVTKMQGLMTMNVKSSLYNEKVKISYILMQAHYCKGIIAKKDLKIMGVEPEVILIIDEITFDTKFRIPREFTYDIIKAIDFNKFLY